MVQEKHNDELLQAVNALVKLKKVPENIVFDALEMVLLTAYKKEQGNGVKASISLDRETGKYKIYADKFVVADINSEDEDAINKITVEEAKKINPEYEEGAYIRIDVTPKDFGRTAAQTAKQVLIQKLREAERGSIFDEFSGREGDIITGTVKWSESKTIFVDLGRIEGILPSTEQIEGEFFEANQKIKCYILEVRKTTKGPEIILSRTHPGLLKRLFELEVPEIYSGTVEIKSVSREAGERTKLAVYAEDKNIDPVGACVGNKGDRVNRIVEELNGEKIDIITWDADPVKFITNALAPAKVEEINIDEEEKIANVKVKDDQLSLAIGKKGQNVRLAAKLTGWKIDIKAAE